MCLLDTLDGALMMALYTSTAAAKDQLAILYYSIVLTLITITVALVIGILQLLTLVLNVANPTGRFWHGVEVAGDHYDIIGMFGPLPPFFSPFVRCSRLIRWLWGFVEKGNVKC